MNFTMTMHDSTLFYIGLVGFLFSLIMSFTSAFAIQQTKSAPNKSQLLWQCGFISSLLLGLSISFAPQAIGLLLLPASIAWVYQYKQKGAVSDNGAWLSCFSGFLAPLLGICGWLISLPELIIVGTVLLITGWYIQLINQLQKNLEAEKTSQISLNIMSEMLQMMQKMPSNSQNAEVETGLDQLKISLQQAQQEISRQESLNQQLKADRNNFIRKISHDLNTPAHAILSALNTLDDSDLLNEQSQQSISIACQGAQTLSRTLEQMQELQALNNGEVRILREPVCPYEMISMLISDTRNRLAAKDVLVDFKWCNEIPKETFVMSDPQKFERIFRELLLNAETHTSSGFIEVTAQLLDSSQYGISLEFQIKDTGSGIPQETLEKLFDPYSRYDDYFHEEGNKVGLSLVIIQGFVQLMGGNFYIDSHLKSGTNAHIRLGFPIAKIQPKHQDHNLSHSASLLLSQHNQTIPQSGIIQIKKPILVVDDNPVNRKLLTALLKKLGLTSKEASNGKEALLLHEQTDFSLILMDCQMPVMNGFEATKAIRRGTKADIPIIAVSANANDEDIEMCYEAGMDDFLAKPVTPERLAQKMIQSTAHRARQGLADSL